MAVAHRSIGSIADGTRTNTTVPAPAGITDGDILVLIWTHGDNATVTPTPPTGFATFSGYTNGMIVDVDPADSGSGEIQLHAWWKRASSESGNYTITHSSAFTEAVCIAYSGALASGDPTTDPTATSNQGTGTATHTATGGTTTTDGNMVIFVETTWDDENALSPPTGTTPTFTERYDPGAANNVLYVADGPLTTAGATGNKSVTGVATNGWGAALLFIQAASGATDFDATGDLDAQAAAVAGSAVVGRTSTGALAAQSSAVSGAATVGRTASGALSAQAASITGTASVSRTATGALSAQAASIAGAAVVGRTASGALAAQDAAVAGDATVESASSNASGDLQAQSASIAGTVTINRAATGALEAQFATISGEATSTAVVVPEVQPQPRRGGGAGFWSPSQKQEEDMLLRAQQIREDEELLVLIAAVLPIITQENNNDRRN